MIQNGIRMAFFFSSFENLGEVNYGMAAAS